MLSKKLLFPLVNRLKCGKTTVAIFGNIFSKGHS